VSEEEKVKKQNIIERRRRKDQKKKETCVKWIEDSWLDLEESRDLRKLTV
jgi:hypothetical protein